LWIVLIARSSGIRLVGVTMSNFAPMAADAPVGSLRLQSGAA
jgi:hypothetical protein